MKLGERKSRAGWLGSALLVRRNAALVLILSLPFGLRAAEAQSRPTPTDAGPASAIRQLLQFLEIAPDDRAAELGARLVRDHPDDATVHALHTIALYHYGGAAEAFALSEQNLARWPNDAWAWTARATALRCAPEAETLTAIARARELAPEDPEIAYHLIGVYFACGQARPIIAIVDSLIAVGRETAALKGRRAAALLQVANRARDTLLVRQALQEFSSAREAGPLSAFSHANEGSALRSVRRTAEALPLLRRAVELDPHTNLIRAEYWRTIASQGDLTTDQKRALILSDMEAHLANRQHALGAMYAVADYARADAALEQAIPLLERIVREHPTSWQAAQVELWRAYRLRDSLPKLSDPDRLVATRRYGAALSALVRRAGVNQAVRMEAHRVLLQAMIEDETVTGEEIWSVSQEVNVPPRADQPTLVMRHLTLPVALAERGIRFREAEALGRAGVEAREDLSERYRTPAMSVSDVADDLDWIRSGQYSATGWVLFHAGDLQGARRELEAAYGARNYDPEIVFRLGRVSEAEGERETAEGWYVLGSGLEKSREGFTENRRALERLYAELHGSLDGIEAYLQAVDERERERARAKVLSRRIATPEPMPPFELEWLDGSGRFDSEGLRGKVAVINFWGVWCGPCRVEAPHIQEFTEQFRNHPDLVFLTISNDEDPETTRRWMEERDLDFPVLLEARTAGTGGLPKVVAERSGVRFYPTTFFIDRDGRIAFSVTDSTPRLVEEYTWRVEALLGTPEE